jgi:CheY-like chemotaxis protein
MQTADSKKTTILLVENEAMVRLNTAGDLRERGFSVIEAAEGPQAIEILNGNLQPDVVFANLNLPGQPDGLDLARWIRSHKPELPIILTSGTIFQGVPANVASAVTELLNEPFFTKPYDISEVVARIRKLLADERAN